MEFTKSQLIKAFQKYNQEILDNPDNYDEIDETESCAKIQTERLIELLEELK